MNENEIKAEIAEAYNRGYQAGLAKANRYKGEALAVQHSVVDALGDATDYEGLPASVRNYLQCIRKMRGIK